VQGRYDEVRHIPRAWVAYRDDLLWVWEAAEKVESTDPHVILSGAFKRNWEAEALLEEVLLPEDLAPLLDAFRHESVERLAKEIAPDGLQALEKLTELSHAMQRDRRSQSVVDFLKDAQERFEAGDDRSVIPTGIEGLDVELKVRPGNVYYLGGHTGHGKSSLALQIALHAAKAGRRTRFFSFEMLGWEIALRAAAQESRVPEAAIIEHMKGETKLDGYDAGKVREAWKALGELPLEIDDFPGGDLDEVIANMTRDKADFYIVDHMHLMTNSGAETRQLEVAGISRRLKLFSMEQEVPVLALVQFKQPDTRRTGTIPPPNLGSIRDSGAPAQDASGVLLLHRHEGEEEWDRTTLTIAKNRGGRFPVTFDLDFDGPIYTFEESKAF
jgi:replicative DNA helicase